MLQSWKLFAACCFCISTIAREAEAIKQIDLPLELNREDYPTDLLGNSYVARRSSSLYSPHRLLDHSQLSLQQLQKRLTTSDKLPKNFFHSSSWETGRRLRRPFLRKSYVDGTFKMSYPPGQKRPYYYAEPEGSEFLGGPGK